MREVSAVQQKNRRAWLGQADGGSPDQALARRFFANSLEAGSPSGTQKNLRKNKLHPNRFMV